MKKKKFKKTFIHDSLVYILFILLGLLFTLVFYLLFRYDCFNLYDKVIILNLNDSYKINIDSKYDIKEANINIEDPKVASIDSDGNIKAHSYGETRIVVKSKYNFYKNYIDLKVSKFPIYSIIFEEDVINIKINDEILLTPIINNDSDIKTNLVWTSSDTSVVSVSSSGMVKGLKSGGAIVSAKDEDSGITALINVQVTEDGKPVEDIEINESSEDALEEDIIDVEKITINTNYLDMYIGDIKKISAIVSPSNATNKKLIYSSSDNTVATVSSNGMISAKKKGYCNIYISSSDGHVVETLFVNVTGNKVKVQNIELIDKDIALKVNEVYMIESIITPNNANDKSLNYSVSNPDVISIDSNGKIKALNIGSSKVIVVSNDSQKVSSMNVNVVANDNINFNNDISVTGIKNNIVVGDKIKIQVNNKNSDTINNSVIYTTSNSEIASVDSSGNLSANSPGFVFLDIETKDGSFYSRRFITVFPNDILANDIYINKKSMQLVKGKKESLTATVIPVDSDNKEISWTSSDNKVVKVDSNGNIVANGVGSATITATVKNTNIKKSITIAVVNKDNMIDIRNKKLTGYYINFRVFDEKTKKMRAMQNFAIENFGSKNEVLYVSYPTRSTHKGKITSSIKNEILRTTIVKIPKKTLFKPESNDRNYMYLNNTGHGQVLEIDNNNYIWTNGNGYIYQDTNGVYWGGNNSIIQIQFKENKKSDKFKILENITFKYNNILYQNPEIAFDYDNNLVAIRSKRKVFIYNAYDFVRGKLNLLYSFTLNGNAIDGTNYSRQGFDINDGYYYQYRGYVGTNMYVEVYNYIGELQYTYIFNPKLKNQEAEGFKIYNDKIFIGVTSTCRGCNGRINGIYYFK